MKALLPLLLAAVSFAGSSEPASLYKLKAKSIDGKPVALAKYRGKVALVVNTASKCGYTPQYKQLQALYDRYQKEGFVVLGFPSNDFHSQEPAENPEIKKFCEVNYGVSFPLFEKAPVTGAQTQPVFRFLKDSPVGSKDGEIGWNFTKFLVDKDGRVAARFPSKIKPDDPQVVSELERLLKKS
jgi:glutathione peroxidase